MSYQVLALKFRPQVFDDVVGQEAVTRTLKNAIRQDRIAHAFLFSGVRGVGKTTTARILAKALNCFEGPTETPCGECPACKEIASSTNLDVLEIDGASNNGVEQVRDIIEASRYAPSRDRFKIYIIDEVHMLTTPAFNALLKTLEEPPPRVKFIFATTEYHRIPDTILSRCQQFEFRTVSSRVIAEQIRRIADRESLEIEEAAVSQLARTAEGSLRDALSAMDQVLAAVGNRITEKDAAELLGLIDHEVLATTARAIVDGDTETILSVVDDLVRGGRDLRHFARGLMQYFRDVLVARSAPDAPELVELAEDRTELAEMGNRLSEEDLVRALDLLTQAEGALRWAPEPRFHLEVALLKLSQLRRLAPFEELLARFEVLEGSRPVSPASKAPKPEKRAPSGASSRLKADSAKPSSPPSAKKPSSSARSKGATSSEPLSPPAATLSPDELVATVIGQLRSSHPKLAALLSHHNGVTIEGDRLHIGFDVDQKFFEEQLQQRELRAVLEKTVEACAGRKLQVEVSLTERARAESEANADAARDPAEPDDTLRERALSEPLVRSFLETFKGEVEDIRPLGEAPPRKEPRKRSGTTKR